MSYAAGCRRNTYNLRSKAPGRSRTTYTNEVPASADAADGTRAHQKDQGTLLVRPYGPRYYLALRRRSWSLSSPSVLSVVYILSRRVAPRWPKAVPVRLRHGGERKTKRKSLRDSGESISNASTQGGHHAGLTTSRGRAGEEPDGRPFCMHYFNRLCCMQKLDESSSLLYKQHPPDGRRQAQACKMCC